MALFSKRVIQRMLDELASHLPNAKLAKIARAIDRADEQSLSFEWELAVLFGLTKLGTVSYEADFGGRRFPDVHFTLRDDVSEGAEFVADIVSISDSGIIRQSLVESFEQDLMLRIENAGHSPENFHVQIEGEITKAYPNQRVRLFLPNKARMKQVMDEKLTPFLFSITTQEEDQLIIKENDFGITISYDSRTRSFGIGHISLSAGFNISENTLSNRLLDKANQLRLSNYKGIKGIVVCDGGASILNHTWIGSGFSDQDVIRHFVRENQDVDFVLVLRLDKDKLWTTQHRVEGYILRNDLTGGAISSAALDKVLEMTQHIPATSRNVLSAQAVLRAGEGHLDVIDDGE